ncbi:uncharacterized protein LOC107175547 [Citrus sinensis]|uniref:uncharacterized protein LOC107175547 n=1 Tax=Citrus sinensis TaxID=2711 RepID=UPI002278A94A|nr:uncharacterized protein LOC107175547 [Citrus sinensis]
MSNQKRKLIVDESDEEIGDSDPNVSIPTDFLGPSNSVGPSHGRDTLEYPRPLTISPSPELEIMGNKGGPASGTSEDHSYGGVGVPEEVGDGEGSSSEPSGPSRKMNIGHKVEADSYPIDFIACVITPTDLFKLRNLYNIPEEVLLVVPGKGDVPSQPPKRYVTMHLESFRLGARLPLQRYFAKILGGMHLAPESWGLVKDLEDQPLLQVETTLVNVSTCQDLLSPTNLVGSGLVDIAAGMDNKILSAMSRKRGRALSNSSNPPPPPKKVSVVPSKASVPALSPPPSRKIVGEKTTDKSSKVSTRSGDRSSPLLARDQGDYLTPYQRDYGKLVGPKMVQDIESMNLNELAGSVQRVSFKLATIVSCYKNRITRQERKLQAENQDLKKRVESANRSKEKLAKLNRQITELEEKVAVAESTSSKLEDELGDLKSDLQATQSERDTLRTALEGEIKSLSEQLAEEKGKSADEEYPELDMSKLEAGVQWYMAEIGQTDKEQGEQDQVEAPLDGVQEGEAGGRAFEVGQGSVPPPPDIADLPPP